jgi:hypothetical protein
MVLNYDPVKMNWMKAVLTSNAVKMILKKSVLVGKVFEYQVDKCCIDWQIQ